MFCLTALKHKNSIIIAARFFISTRDPAFIPSPSHYDDLINAAGRNGDFAAVRRLLSERQTHGCLNTNNTFKFIATKLSTLNDLLETLAALGGNWFARKNAHDALISQLSRVGLTAEALRVAGIAAEKRFGATAATFNPILNALSHRRETSDAWRVVDAMRASGVRPDLMSFNYILTANCFVGDVAAASETLVKMEAEGMAGDAITYDALVLGACRAGKVEAAVAVMRRMVGEGLPPLFSSHAHIIKEMVGRGCYKAAVEYVRIFAGKDKRLDAENYGCLVRRLWKSKRIAEAKLVVEEMRIRGLPIGQVEDAIELMYNNRRVVCEEL